MAEYPAVRLRGPNVRRPGKRRRGGVSVLQDTGHRTQDRDAAFPLDSDDFSFTSPQDDHIDKAAFFERCFPTADRLRDQRLLHVTPADDDLVLVHYEYELTTGDRHRNVEAITVRDRLIQEVQVFFGGKV